MSLFNLCLDIQTALITSQEDEWGLLKVPRDLKPEVVLDPDVIYQCQERKLFIMPVQHLPIISESGGRHKVRQLAMNYVFAMGLLIPMTTFKYNDMAQQGDVSSALDLWERIDTFVIKNIPLAYQIKDVVPEPPVEIEMNQKNFLVMTEYTVEFTKCIEV